MNHVNFLGRPSFPLSVETLQFMQEMTQLTARLVLIGGSDMYILDGCTEVADNVEPGYVVIHGEIFPFAGGIKQPTVFIKDEKRSVTALGYEYPDVYSTRSVHFGIGEKQYTWDDFKRLETNTSLLATITRMQTQIDALKPLPAGIVVMWFGNPGQVPAGWALCDGLDGRPNLLGKFPVGYNQNDPDYNAIGKTGGLKEVSLTIEQMPAHKHGGVPVVWPDVDRGGNASRFNLDTDPGETASAGGGLGHENRPPYFVLAFIIKL